MTNADDPVPGLRNLDELKKGRKLGTLRKTGIARVVGVGGG